MTRNSSSTIQALATVAFGLAMAGWCGCSLPGTTSLAAPTTPKAEDWLAEARSKPNAKPEQPAPAEKTPPLAEKKPGERKPDVSVRGQSPESYPSSGYASSPGGYASPSGGYAAPQSGYSAPATTPTYFGPPANGTGSARPGSGAATAGYQQPVDGAAGASGNKLNWASPAAFLNENGQGPVASDAGVDPYAGNRTNVAQNGYGPGGFAPAPGAYDPNALPPTSVPGGPLSLPSPGDTIGDPGSLGLGLPPNFADVDAFVEEARTGRLIIGAGINSEAGVTGQVIVDERNFDLFAFPRSFDDFAEGRAFRGNGQGFRLEAIPGTNVQRYLVSLSDPYLFNTLVTSNLSAFYFERDYFDYDEQRVGGRLSLGYRLTQDLSFSVGSRIENIKIGDPRVAGVQELDEVIGSNELYSGQASVTYDTRDIPFFPTEGQFLELSYEQVFGDFEYPRFEADYRRYFLLHERADGSGRHTLAAGARFGITGPDTPLYDNYFAGGFSTLRGFDFRGASPVNNTVTVGGEMRVLTSVEYFFPLTADDMIKGVLFCDAGTVEEKPGIDWDEFRVAPGFGFRLNVPALGAAPLAFDFAFPVARADFDDTQIFSFYIGIGKL